MGVYNLPIANTESQRAAPKQQDFWSGKWSRFVKAVSHTKQRPQRLVTTKKAARDKGDDKGKRSHRKCTGRKGKGDG